MPQFALFVLLASNFWFNGINSRSVNILAQSQQGVQITSPPPIYLFGQTVPILANMQTSQTVQQVDLYIGSKDKDVQVLPVTINPDNSLVSMVAAHQGALRPFSRIYYWYKVEFKDNSLYTSPSFWFDYNDNRFTWHTLDSNLFRIHWIDGDQAFGQSVLDVAQTGFKATQALFPVIPPSSPIDIYVYSHAKDLQSALELGGLTWVAGHASPDLGVVLVSLPQGPDQRLEMEQQVPHEIDHVLLYQLTGPAYSQLPAWLVEGMASIVEQYPNSDYPHALQTARQNNTLLPLSSLCQAFPRDASGAFLAYAEAESFTRYIDNTYGASGIQNLIHRYLDGLGCSEGVSAALGVPLNTLEYRWHQEVLGMDVAGLALNRMLPYLVLAGVLILPPFGLVFYKRKSKDRSSRER